MGSTLKRIGLSATMNAETRLSEAVGPAELAIGCKPAIVDAAIHKVTEEFGGAVVSQLDCSCVFSIAENLPHLLVPVGQWLRALMRRILRTEEGDPIGIKTVDGLPQ